MSLVKCAMLLIFKQRDKMQVCWSLKITDYSGSDWGNWGKLMVRCQRCKLEDAGSRNAMVSLLHLAVWNQ